MPVPALSFATRFYHANAGIMVTASRNPKEYNGYKAYGSEGCQRTDEDTCFSSNGLISSSFVT